MLQNGGLYPTARPLEWLVYLARVYPGAADPRQLLELVGIDPSSRTTTRRMSGGEQQRLKMAAALLPNPELLFLDEPTAGMDPQARRHLLTAISELRSNGVAIVLTTHQLADIDELADRVIVLRQGVIESDGTLAELRGDSSALTFDARPGIDLGPLHSVIPAGYSAREVSAGRYVVEGEPTPEVLARVASWLADMKETTTGIRIGRSSLEDIIIGDES
jgi:ABC-2 type transport system ATP-binding protein